MPKDKGRKKKSKSEPKKRGVSSNAEKRRLLRLLSNVADYFGVWEHDIVKQVHNPSWTEGKAIRRLFKRHGFKKKQLTLQIAREARALEVELHYAHAKKHGYTLS